jgi:hypothetical protein
MRPDQRKSDLIWQEKQRNPRASAPAIQAALAKQGVRVNLSYVRLVLLRKNRIDGYDREARRRRVAKSLGSETDLICRLLEENPTMTPLELREELSRRAFPVTLHTIKRTRHEWRKRIQDNAQAEEVK